MIRKILVLAIAVGISGCASLRPTPLQTAALSGDMKTVRSLLNQGASVDEIGSYGGIMAEMKATPLHAAAQAGHLEIVRLLLNEGSYINALSGGGTTPLHNAVATGRFFVVDFLLKEGANPNAGGGGGFTSLHQAAANGHADIVEILLDAGAKVDVVQAYWLYTPLHHAAQGGHTDIARLLVERGASLTKRIKGDSWVGRPNETPAGVARWKGHSGTAAYLEEEASESKLRKEMVAKVKREELERRVRREITGASEPYAAPPRQGARAALPPPLSPSFSSRAGANDFALIVGIENYSELPKAEFAERDAEAFKEHMLALGIPRRNVIHLSGSKAGRSSIVKYLNSWLPKNVKPNSRVYFFFSGHGAPDVENGQAYLVPWDGDANFLEDTAYPVKRLYSRLAKLPAKEVIVVLDACFSGAGGRSVLARGARPLVTKVDIAKAPGGKVTLFTAASANEITASLPEKGHGMFTYFFLKGLNGAAKDPQGRVTAKSLFRYIKPHVQDEARRQNREQTPTVQYQTNVVLRSR